MRGAGMRARRDGERDLALAHTGAAFGRAKRLERLDYYLTRMRGGKKDQRSLLDRVKAIAARTRGEG